MSQIQYKDRLVVVVPLDGFEKCTTDSSLSDYTVSNGNREFSLAYVSGLGMSFGRNHASAIRGIEKMVDDDIARSTYTFNPNTRRAAGRAKEQRGGGRRKATRGKKAK